MKVVNRVRAAALALALHGTAALAQQGLEDLPRVKQNLDLGFKWVYAVVGFAIAAVALWLVVKLLQGRDDLGGKFAQLLLAAGLYVGLGIFLQRLGITMPGIGFFV